MTFVMTRYFVAIFKSNDISSQWLLCSDYLLGKSIQAHKFNNFSLDFYSFCCVKLIKEKKNYFL